MNQTVSDIILKKWCEKLPKGFPITETNGNINERDLNILKEVIDGIIKSPIAEARLFAHPEASYIPNPSYKNKLVDVLGDTAIVDSMSEMPLVYNDSPRLSNNSTIFIVGAQTLKDVGKYKDIQDDIKKISRYEREIDKAPTKKERQRLERLVDGLKNLDEMLSLHSDHTVWQSEALPETYFFIEKTGIKLFTAMKGTEVKGLSANSTDLKEALVGYGYFMDSAELQEVLKYLYDKEPASLQTLNVGMAEIPDMEKYFGVDLTDFITRLFTTPLNQLRDDERKTVLNAFSSATKIKEMFNDRSIVDRGKFFESIRKKARKLISDQDLKVDADKWCPADIYLYGNYIDTNVLDSVETLTGPTGLNALFANNSNELDKIVAVSLKEDRALQGKSTSIVNVSKDLKIPDKEFSKLRLDSEMRNYLNTLQVEIRKVLSKHGIEIKSQRTSLNLGGLLRGKGVVELQRLKPNKNGPNPKFNPEALRDLIELSNQQKAQHQKFIEHFKKYRNKFYGVVTEYNASQPSYTEDDIPIDTMIKKAGVYKFALFVSNREFFDQIKKALSKKNVGQQTMRQYTNPFVALCAYAIGISGLNPTFWKVTGSTNNTPPSVVKLQGDTILKFNGETDMEIVDNFKSTDMTIKYIVDSNIEDGTGTKNKKYKVSIQFRYSLDSIRVEVSEFKEDK